jgi:uncharacterized membrane protein YidH (DUF202 family)
VTKKKSPVMGVVFVFLGFVAIFSAILLYCQNIRKMNLKIPAPFVLPIIGHAHLIVGLSIEGEDQFDFVNYSTYVCVVN